MPEKKFGFLPHLKNDEPRSKVICDICRHEVGKTYVDGATTMGPWANMCERCFQAAGIGLGTGRGQRYDAETGVKVEG